MLIKQIVTVFRAAWGKLISDDLKPWLMSYLDSFFRELESPSSCLIWMLSHDPLRPRSGCWKSQFLQLAHQCHLSWHCATQAVL